MSDNELRDTVARKYGELARRAAAESVGSGCCGPAQDAAACCAPAADPITSNLYGEEERGAVPAAAMNASLGCGNPTALIDLQPGQTVLDLGSGGGIDVLLSARRVGPGGKAYGLDMTDDMLALARDNQAKAGATNVEFLKGEIEHIPLPDHSVDVVISNCVINLSTDKDQVLAEAFRVLRPGGRFAVSDVVVRGEVPADIRLSAELWIGCIAGALQETEYREKLARAGFDSIEVDTWRTYDIAGAPGQFSSAFVRARKPAACCGSECCSGEGTVEARRS